MNNILVAIRVDASYKIGTGHVMRCLTLANELRKHGARIIFICYEFQGHMIAKLEEYQYVVHRLPIYKSHDAQTLLINQEHDVYNIIPILRAQNIDWLIVDHYGLDLWWESQVRLFVKKILVIDDLANREHWCHVLLDQNYFASKTEFRYRKLVAEHCRCLLGPQYAMLQPQYAQVRPTLEAHQGHVHRILVFFGGADQSHETEQVLVALNAQQFANIEVDVVIGSNYSNLARMTHLVEQRPKTRLYQNLPTLALLMKTANLFIGAGGATTWERLCLGLPSIVISVAKNQDEITEVLAKNHFQISLPHNKACTPSDWIHVIKKVIAHPGLLCELSENAKRLVDGLGTKRVSRLILDCEKIVLRKAALTDKVLLFLWANDPETRKQSFSSSVISMEEHTVWFENKISDSNCVILIGETQRGYPIGQVRFEIRPQLGSALVSISLDKNFRSLGLSEQLLARSIAYLRKLNMQIKLLAEVRAENRSSERLFTKLNFLSIETKRVGSKMFVLTI